MKDTRDALKFTRMCKYWKVNRCNLGADCNFAHSEVELRDQPDLVSTRLCFQFARKGHCKNGEECTFAHGKSELRRLPKAGKHGRDNEAKQVPNACGGNGQQAESLASLAMLSTMASAPQAGMRSQMTSALSVDTMSTLSFRPPPGLGTEDSSANPPGLGIFAPESIQPKIFAALLRESLESSHRKSLLKQSSRDGLVDELPIYLDAPGIFELGKRDVDVATESVASTAWMSGCPSDGSEPASPKNMPIWL